MTRRPTQQTKRANGTKRAGVTFSWSLYQKRCNALRSDAANTLSKWPAMARHMSVAIKTEPLGTLRSTRRARKRNKPYRQARRVVNNEGIWEREWWMVGVAGQEPELSRRDKCWTLKTRG